MIEQSLRRGSSGSGWSTFGAPRSSTTAPCEPRAHAGLVAGATTRSTEVEAAHLPHRDRGRPRRGGDRQGRGRGVRGRRLVTVLRTSAAAGLRPGGRGGPRAVRSAPGGPRRGASVGTRRGARLRLRRTGQGRPGRRRPGRTRDGAAHPAHAEGLKEQVERAADHEVCRPTPGSWPPSSGARPPALTGGGRQSPHRLRAELTARIIRDIEGGTMEPRTIDIDGELDLVVQVPAGDVRIGVTDGTTATVSITGERSPDDLTIEASASAGGGTRLVVAHHKESALVVPWQRAPRRHRVPTRTAVEAVTGSADLVVDGELGDLAFRSDRVTCGRRSPGLWSRRPRTATCEPSGSGATSWRRPRRATSRSGRSRVPHRPDGVGDLPDRQPGRQGTSLVGFGDLRLRAAEATCSSDRCPATSRWACDPAGASGSTCPPRPAKRSPTLSRAARRAGPVAEIRATSVSGDIRDPSRRRTLGRTLRLAWCRRP